MELLASLVDSLAWPASLAMVVFLLRNALRRLIPDLHNMRYKELELEFGRKVARLDEKAAAAELPSPIAPQAKDVDSVVNRLVPISPRAAVTEAWREVELAMREAAQRHNVDLSQQLGVRLMAENLRDAGVLSPAAVEVLTELRILRNEALHAREVDLSAEDAWEYASVAERLRGQLASSHSVS